MLKTGYDRLDGLAGGLVPNCAYVAFGERGSGKISFALSYLMQGLLAGESCALITRSTVPLLLGQAQRLGFDLKPFLESGRLAAYEYQSNPTGVPSRMDDDQVAITSEFRSLFAGAPVSRLVVDALSPLLPPPTLPAIRPAVSALVSTFRKLGAACLYVIDTPEDQGFVAPFRDESDGVLHFSRSNGTAVKQLLIERLPGLDSGPTALAFEITPGVGLVDYPVEPSRSDFLLPSEKPGRNTWADASLTERFLGARRSPEELQGFVRRGQRDLLPRNAGWKALVIDPAASRRQLIRDLLHPMCEVMEASGAADGLAMANGELPDLVIIYAGARGASGVEITRKLRQNGKNAPIILIGIQQRRSRDQVAALVAGVDACLSWPLDGRILKLNAYNLLRRWTPALNDVFFPSLAADFMAPVKFRYTCTMDLEYFRSVIETQAEYCAKFAVSFAVVTLQLPPASEFVEELSAAVALTARTYDVTFVGERGVAVLLVETFLAEPFLARLAERWGAQQSLSVDYYCYTREEDSVARAMNLVTGQVGPVVSAEPAPEFAPVPENPSVEQEDAEAAEPLLTFAAAVGSEHV